jgi:hypothetical protein
MATTFTRICQSWKKGRDTKQTISSNSRTETTRTPNGDDMDEEDESERSYAGFDVDTRLRTLDFENDYGRIGYLSEELISHCKELAE